MSGNKVGTDWEQMKIFLDSEKIHTYIPLFPAFPAPFAARFRLLRQRLLRPPPGAGFCRLRTYPEMSASGAPRGRIHQRASVHTRAHGSLSLRRGKFTY